MNEENVCGTYVPRNITVINRNEADIGYNLVQPWQHYGKSNNPETRRQILHNSTCMRYLE